MPPEGPEQNLAEPTNAVAIEPEREIRFAVVMYGGVSLAIYINGVAQELLNMVRATAAAQSKPESGGKRTALLRNDQLSGTEPVYRKIGQYLEDRGKLREAATPEEKGKSPHVTDAAIRAQFVVDVISGTSAGGINGVFLAKALARNQKMDGLKKLWLQEGDLDKLLNDPLSVVDLAGLPVKKPQESLLNSQRMYCKLLEALEQLELSTAKPQAAGKETPLVGELDLFITTTDIEGVPLPISLADRVVYERRYKNVFHFRYETSATTGCNRNDFIPANDPFLAFAARCTSSFPFAFEPMQLDDIEPVLRGSPYHAPSKESDEWDHFFSEYLRLGLFDIDQRSRVQPATGLPGSGNQEEREEKAKQQLRKSFWSRSFGDGGYLDNKPFSHATSMLMRRSADVVVDRKLLYVEPSPDHPELARTLRTRPDFAENVRAAVLDLPRQETIREDIDRLYDRNEVIKRINRFAQRVDEDIARLPAFAPMSGQLFRTSDLDDMIKIYGIAYGAYHRLRVNEITELLSSMITRLAGHDPSSDAAVMFREITARWRSGRYPDVRTAGALGTENKFLFTFDIRYRFRRIAFLNRRLNTLGDVDAKGGLGPAAMELLEAWKKNSPLAQNLNLNTLSQTWIADFRKKLNEIKSEQLNKALVATRCSEEHLIRCGERATRELAPAQIAALSAKDRADYLLGRKLDEKIDKLDLPWRSIEKLIMCEASVRTRWIRWFLRTRTGDLFSLAAIIANQFRTAYSKNIKLPGGGTNTSNGADAAVMIYNHYYEYFRYYDLVTYPVQYGTGVGEANVVDVFRVSPEDATSLIDERRVGETRRKLAGTALMSFGAFLDRGWRKNDMLWGRLDGAERIISALLPGRDQSTTEIRDDLIKQAHVAIFREEIHSDDVDTLRLLLSNMLARVDPASEQQRTLREVIETALAAEKKTLPAAFQSALQQVFKDPEEIREYYRERFEVDRQFEAGTALRLISRATNITGEMLGGLAAKIGFDPGKRAAAWIARFGTVFWGMIAVAVPQSLGNLFFRHWLGLLYFLSFITITLGVILPGGTPVKQVGWSALGISIGLSFILFLVGDFITGRRGWLQVAGTLLVVAIAALVGLGVKSTVDFLTDTAHWPHLVVANRDLFDRLLAATVAALLLVAFTAKEAFKAHKSFLAAPSWSFNTRPLLVLSGLAAAVGLWAGLTGPPNIVDLEFGTIAPPQAQDAIARVQRALAIDYLFILLYVATYPAYCVAAAKLFWRRLDRIREQRRQGDTASESKNQQERKPEATEQRNEAKPTLSAWTRFFRLFGERPSLARVSRRLVAIGFLLAAAQVVAGLSDMGENTALLWYLTHQRQPVYLNASQVCATVKFVLIASGLIYSCAGFSVGIFQKSRDVPEDTVAHWSVFAVLSFAGAAFAITALVTHPQLFQQLWPSIEFLLLG